MPPKRKKGTQPQRTRTIKTKTRKRKYNKNHEKENSSKNTDCADSENIVETRAVLIYKGKSKKKATLKLAPPIKSIFCNECNKRFRFQKSYLSHLRNEHSKAPGSVSCQLCPVRCPNNDILTKHITDIHERQIFPCPHCNKKFVRHSHVLRHLAQKGCDGQGVAAYPCEICHAKFSRKDNLMVHLRLQHILQKDFACKQCPYSTRTFSKLIVHVQNVHSEGRVYECDHCGRVTSSRAAISKHLEIHGDKKYACDVCGYSTFTIEVMRRHVLTHVREKPYKCSTCQQSFIQRAQLKKHVERHNGKLCTVCDKSFNTNEELVVHAREHVLGDEQFVCPFEHCATKQKFASEEGLRDHVKTHLDYKPLACEVCNKRFKNELHMKRHVLSHTLERPRRCMYCVHARAYVRGVQLVRHVRKMHPNVFREHLTHVRRVLGTTLTVERVTKSEMETVLNVMDAEADRILQGYGEGVLYGGMQENDDAEEELPVKSENSPLMSEEDLEANLKKLLSQLIDRDTLQCFGWPEETVDTVLEKVIEQCGARPADRSKWTRVQRLRENSKQLFLYALEDKNIARMLDTHTIDQIIKHVLTQVTDTDAASKH